MVKISGTTIVMTRGDTLQATISVTDADGNVYTPGENDKLRFALKKNFTDDETLILLDIPIDTCLLRVDSSHTKELDQPGTYVYDIQLTIDDNTDEGVVDTIISGKLKLKEEVE